MTTQEVQQDLLEVWRLNREGGGVRHRGITTATSQLRRGRRTNPEEAVSPEVFQVLPRPDQREVVEGWNHPKDLPRPDPRVDVVVRDHPMLLIVN